MTDLARQSEVERLRHENECLHKRVAQLDYPCSPHCDGYLRELRMHDEHAAEIARLTAEVGRLSNGDAWYGDDLVARVSPDGTIGIDHPTDADWNDILARHEALYERLAERIAEKHACPFRTALAAKD